MYGLNRRRTFKVGYMARDSKSSQEHRKHNEKSIVQGDLSSAKNK